MTLEEKIQHLQSTSMEEARAEGNAIIQTHTAALERIFNDHKEAALRQGELRIKTETNNSRQELNKALAKSQTELKRDLGKRQEEFKGKIFARVMELLEAYMKTEAYIELLISYIQKAMRFANGADMTLYLNPSDEGKKSDLEDATGARLTISARDFVGGIRAVVKDRNILIDHSFQSALADEYEKFLFTGGADDE